MATLVVNKPGAGLDSGRQGSRGTAVVKVRDLACSVHHRPPFVHPGDPVAAPRPWLLGRDARPLGPFKLYEPCPPLRDLYLARPEVTWSAPVGPLLGQRGHL